MLYQAIDTVTDHSWIPSSVWRRLGLPEQKKLVRKKADFLDDVPVMLATVLGLEILLHEPCIDLGMASELILSDVGATIQILRLVGSEYELLRSTLAGWVTASLVLTRVLGSTLISARTFPAIASTGNYFPLESLSSGGPVCTTSR